jgi:hypothetical protein
MIFKHKVLIQDIAGTRTVFYENATRGGSTLYIQTAE